MWETSPGRSWPGIAAPAPAPAPSSLTRYFPKNTMMVGSEIGRLPPQVFFQCKYPLLGTINSPSRIHSSPLHFKFGDAAAVANAVLTCGYEFDTGKMLFNYYKSVVSYDTTTIPIFSQGRGPFNLLLTTLLSRNSYSQNQSSPLRSSEPTTRSTPM